MVKKTQLDAVVQAVSRGLPITAACKIGNISPPTFYTRLKSDSKFRRQIELAEVNFMESQLAIIDKAADKSWPAAAWRLERRFPAYFSLRNRDTNEQKIIRVNLYGIFRQGKNGKGKALPGNAKRITNARHRLKEKEGEDYSR